MKKNLGLAIVVTLGSVIALLAQTKGKEQAKGLPEGNGKAIVESACSVCHATNLVTAGHTPEDWKLLMERMLAAGAQVPPNQVATVSEYLTKNFPEGNVPKAVIVPGTVKVSFKEWKVPTAG